MTYEEIAVEYERLAAIQESLAADIAAEPGAKKPFDYSYLLEKALQYRSEANRQRSMADKKAAVGREHEAQMREFESAIAWRRDTVALQARNVEAWESIAATLAKRSEYRGP